MHEEAVGDAPGRVNLMGEHTDYHDGYVLPTIIPQRTRVHLRRRGDSRICAWTAAAQDVWEEFQPGRETRGRGWLDYVQGVTAMLARRGTPVPGMDVRVTSDVPVGAGVSSSAALEVALLRAIRTMLGLDLDDITLARIAQSAETDFVGAPVGIMDQMASSLGRNDEALFLDTRTLQFERVPLPPSLGIGVINSGVAHEHAGGEYATRRRESYEAAALLGVERLRDVDRSALPRLAGLPPILVRRARHVITENARVLAAVEALRAADARRLGDLFNESHASMRHDYETSTPEVDALVAIAQQDPGVHGARLTGGGFGGAIVLLADPGRVRAATRRISEQYHRTTGRTATVLVPPA